jgi:hypothetical protein
LRTSCCSPLWIIRYVDQLPGGGFRVNFIGRSIYYLADKIDDRRPMFEQLSA